MKADEIESEDDSVLGDQNHSNTQQQVHVLNQEGGQKSQQISAAIIKKIQNNYQVQVNTTGFDQEQRQLLETASGEALNSINQKLRKEQTPALKYLHAIQEISEVYPNNVPLT